MVGHDGHRGWLYYVAAAPDMRGIGVGRRMVEAAQEWLRTRGVVKVQILVRETNADVVSFYERLGFETTPRVVMGKWLRDPPQTTGGQEAAPAGTKPAVDLVAHLVRNEGTGG